MYWVVTYKYVSQKKIIKIMSGQNFIKASSFAFFSTLFSTSVIFLLRKSLRINRLL